MIKCGTALDILGVFGWFVMDVGDLFGIFLVKNHY